MTRKLTPGEKVGRKPTLRACTFCHLKHLQCLNTRPCQNCVKRKIEHGCKDIVRKRALYLLPGRELKISRKNSAAASEHRSSSSASSSLQESSAGECFPELAPAGKPEAMAPEYPSYVVLGPPLGTLPDSSTQLKINTDAQHQTHAEPRPQMATMEPRMATMESQMATIEPQPMATMEPQMATMEPLESQTGSTHTSLDTFQEQSRETPGSTPSTTANFHSMFLNQEYMMLGDLILKPLLPSPAFAPVPGQLVTPEFFGGLDGMGDGAESRPYISLGDGAGKLARENGFNFDLRASDDQEYVLPLLSHHIYQTVQDIYSNRIINFDYPLSYHSLTFFLKNRFSVASKHATPEVRARKRHNLLVILKLIASYRPTFISAHKSLFQPFDFQFLEMLFQRCLLDFENLSRLNASPMIIWRRTGEIVLMLAHLADILGLNISDVLSKRTFIIELMYDDESIVEYFRLFKSVAIGSLHLTIFTKCKLIKRPSDHRMSTSKTNARLTDVAFIEFCSVWTVKRDLFDLPMMIVGHFLPSLPNSDAVRSY